MHTTFLDHVFAAASASPDLNIVTFLSDGEEKEEAITYAALCARARALGHTLIEHGLTRQPVLLLFPPGLDYIAALLGCMAAGAIAIPAPPPDQVRLRATLPHLLAITHDAGPAAVLTTAAIRGNAQDLLPPMPWIAVDTLSDEPGRDWRRPDLTEADFVMCQYTSGSVGDPKGAMLSHGNLLANQLLIRNMFGHHDDTSGVLWLPHTFDMGCHGILQALYLSRPVATMSPLAFLQKPVRWLAAISRLRATTSGGPNFAYELCVRRIPVPQREGLDLSSWTVAFNGAEPIRPDTLDRFAAEFEPYGFSRKAFLCCYGSAEMTLIATGGPPGNGPSYLDVDAAALESGDVREPAPGQATRTLVGNGEVPDGLRLRIVDPSTLTECPPGRVGEVWIDGASKAQGYLGRTQDSQETFSAALPGDNGTYLRTGDLGFLHDGQLYLAGRRAELIIVDGRNHYAHDLEQTAERAHPAVLAHSCVAFSGQADEVVLLAEVDPRAASDHAGITNAIRHHISETHGIRLHEVCLLRRGALLKTASGKVRRPACRSAWISGELKTIGRSD